MEGIPSLTVGKQLYDTTLFKVVDCLKLIVNLCCNGSSLILSDKVHATVEFLNRVCIPEST